MADRPRARAALILIATALLALSGCDDGDSDDGQRPVTQSGSGSPTTPATAGTSTAGWHHLTDVPVRRRQNPIVAMVGTRLVVLGGTKPVDCPRGSFGCVSPPAPGGAVLDLTTSRWRPMRHVPAAARFASVDVVGGRLAILGGQPPQRLLLYDPAHDTWRATPPSPIAGHGDARLDVVGGRIWVTGEGSVRPAPAIQNYDPRTNAWTTVSLSARARRFAGRQVLGDADHLFLVGATRLNHHSAYHAHVEERTAGAWTALPDPPTPAMCAWAWADGRLVAPVCGSTHPRSGVDYDAAHHAWEPIAAPDAVFGAGFAVDVLVPSDRGLFTTRGLVYDAPEDRWQQLTAPASLHAEAVLGAWAGDRVVVIDDNDGVWLSPALG